jgi:hypothetical protein
MTIFFKLKNLATCAHFCRRLLELNPGQKVGSQGPCLWGVLAGHACWLGLTRTNGRIQYGTWCCGLCREQMYSAQAALANTLFHMKVRRSELLDLPWV